VKEGGNKDGFLFGFIIGPTWAFLQVYLLTADFHTTPPNVILTLCILSKL